MGLFDFFKKKRSLPDDQAVADSIIQSMRDLANSPPPNPISNKDYQDLRQKEIDWLEQHYDFTSVESINKIPERPDLPRPPGDSTTGNVYYYLKFKAREYEAANKPELAIACFRKSIALMRLKYGSAYGKEESYSFVRMLARNGFAEDAYAEKAATDKFYNVGTRQEDLERFTQLCQTAKILRTDLVIMSAHSYSCPECAKYQGRVYSLSGKSKQFPKIPSIITKTGGLHKDCAHTLSTYIHGANDPQLEYTLSVHPLQEKQYGKDIISFSNRPFVDDRTTECKQQSEVVQEKLRIEKEKKKKRSDDMIEREYQKWLDSSTFVWLQENFPDNCPKNLTSFKRMRTQNTKNYQILKQLAAEQGREI